MITAATFEDIIIQNIEYESHGYGYTPIEKEARKDISDKSYELAKQLAIDFMDWKMTQFLEEEDGVFFDQKGEVFAETSEELFNLYLKSQE